MWKKYKFTINGLDCANCAKEVEEHLSKNKDYKNVVLNFALSTLEFETNIQDKDVLSITQKLIHEVEPDVTINVQNIKYKVDKNQIILICISLFVFVISLIVPNNIISNILLIISYLIIMAKTIQKAFNLLKKGIIEESLLIVIACFGSYFLGEHIEGYMVIFLYSIGKILESLAINSSRKSIKDLIDIKPEYANLKQGKEYKKANPKDVKIGDILVIKQGEKVPVDCIVLDGSGYVNTSSLTGESKPFYIKQNDEILSGSILETGLIHSRATKIFSESAACKVLDLIENANNKKAKTQNLVERLSRIYTPIIIICAIFIAFILPFILNDISNINSYIYKALVFLVISCPCAIVISIPLSYFMAIGKASKYSILFKGSAYLDNLKDVNKIFLDKTGTITNANFEVEEFELNKVNLKKLDLSQKELECIIYNGEKNSNHPIAITIVNYLKHKNPKIQTIAIDSFEEIPGFGVGFVYNDLNIKIGKNSNQVDDVINIIDIVVNDLKAGTIKLEDKIKDTSKIAIDRFKKNNIDVYMLTGDNKSVANDVAKKVGISNVFANLLPQDKYNILDEEISKNKKENINKKVIFVGDGINDGPVLRLSDIGISMGMSGQALAIENSDIVLLNDDLNTINTAIEISKFSNKIIIENLIFALGVKILVLILTLFGITNMFMAVFADVGTTLITIANSFRILRKKY